MKLTVYFLKNENKIKTADPQMSHKSWALCSTKLDFNSKLYRLTYIGWEMGIPFLLHVYEVFKFCLVAHYVLISQYKGTMHHVKTIYGIAGQIDACWY